MADELTITTLLKYRSDNVEIAFGKTGLQVDVTGTDYQQRTQELSTSREAVGLGEITTAGYGVFTNLSTSGNVIFMRDLDNSELLELGPGEWCLFRVYASGALWAKSSTGTVRLGYLLIED